MKTELAFKDKRAAWFLIGAAALIVLLALYAGPSQTSQAAVESQAEPQVITPSEESEEVDYSGDRIVEDEELPFYY